MVRCHIDADVRTTSVVVQAGGNVGQVTGRLQLAVDAVAGGWRIRNGIATGIEREAFERYQHTDTPTASTNARVLRASPHFMLPQHAVLLRAHPAPGHAQLVRIRATGRSGQLD